MLQCSFRGREIAGKEIVSGERPAPAVTIAFLDAHRDRFPVAVMCRVLEFSERTFYAAKTRPASARSLTDTDRKTVIEVEVE